MPEALLGMLLAAQRMMLIEAPATPRGRITGPQFRILNYLLGRPGASLSQVAAHLGVRLPTASVMLVKLAADGLVVRRRDPLSRRRMQLHLTEAGEETVARLRETLFTRLAAAYSRLEAAQQERLRQAIPALSQLVEVA